MCVIIDANAAHKFSAPPHADVKPVVDWLTSPRKKGHTVVGGALKRELYKVGCIVRFFRVLKEAGRLIEIDDTLVDGEETIVAKLLIDLGYHKADDPHVLALARLSDARLLVTEDKRSQLMDAFRDKRIIDPKGRIYLRASKDHVKLLRKPRPCRLP